MVDDIVLAQLLRRTEIPQKDKFLLILFASAKPTPSSQIIGKAISLGLHEAEKWNPSSSLSRAKGLVKNLKDGWLLIEKGKEYLEGKDYFSSPVKQKLNSDLRSLLPKIKSQVTRDFLEEAIGCYESHFFRAAIVLSWAGAMYVLREYIVNNKLTEFNNNAQARFPKWKPAQDEDDLGKMGDGEFLETLDAIGVITKSVKLNLKSLADSRNGCGHPSNLNIGDNQVAAYLESLINHIFIPFA